MRIIFKKSKTSVLLRMITFFTGGGYGHVELIFSDGIGFSSVPIMGVRMKKISQLDGYHIINLNTGRDQEESIRRYCDSLVGEKYNYLGLLKFILSWDVDGAGYYCSQLCSLILCKMGVLNHGCNKISPSELYDLCS